ncbi:MAG: ribonuclease E/G, partial [Halocynthiibacter sp.]
MKGRTAALGRVAGRPAAALIVDGQLDDFLIAAADEEVPVPGTIYRAVVDRQFKGQGGVILRLTGSSAFLRQGKGLAPGQRLTVQVTGYGEPGKATPVTQKILFKSRYAIVTPGAPGINISRAIKDDDTRDQLLEIAHDAMAEQGQGQQRQQGLIVRSAANGADPAEISEDIEAMCALAERVTAEGDDAGPALLWDGPDPHHLAWREWATPDNIARHDSAFEDLGILDLLSAFLTAHVPLPGGAHMYVEPTRALVAIDVNTGADTSPAAALKANISAARALPRQLRIRGLGGQITVDFAPMHKKD